MSKHSMAVAGIDTGKHKLDVALNDGKTWLQVGNDPAGHAELSGWLRRRRVKRVGIEASGGYERDIVRKLRADGFVVVLFQPKQVRAYAMFHLQLAKNDKIDAALIAACTADTRKLHAAPDPRLEPFAEHLTVIEQIEEDIVRFKTRLEHVRDPQSRRLIERQITQFTALRARELKRLADDLRKHQDLGRRLVLAMSVDGVGERTALACVIRMPELGDLSREQVAALAGLAPYDDDSSDRRGERHIEGGRGRLRRSIYAASLPAALRWNPQLIALYKRLIAAGKPHKVALIACARKLLIFVNIVLVRGTEWKSARAA